MLHIQMSTITSDIIRCRSIEGPVEISSITNTPPLSLHNMKSVERGNPIGIMGFDDGGSVRPVDMQLIIPIYGSDTFEYTGSVPMYTISSNPPLVVQEDSALEGALTHKIISISVDPDESASVGITCICRCDMDAPPMTVAYTMDGSPHTAQVPIAGESFYVEGTIFLSVMGDHVLTRVLNPSSTSTLIHSKVIDAMGIQDTGLIDAISSIPSCIYEPYLSVSTAGRIIDVNIVGMLPFSAAVVKANVVSTTML